MYFSQLLWTEIEHLQFTSDKGYWKPIYSETTWAVFFVLATVETWQYYLTKLYAFIHSREVGEPGGHQYRCFHPLLWKPDFHQCSCHSSVPRILPLIKFQRNCQHLWGTVNNCILSKIYMKSKQICWYSHSKNVSNLKCVWDDNTMMNRTRQNWQPGFTNHSNRLNKLSVT